MADTKIHTEVAGRVVRLLVAPGQRVAPDDELLLVEAMKMELPVLATAAGTVRQWLVDVDDRVDEGQAVVVLDAPA